MNRFCLSKLLAALALVIVLALPGTSAAQRFLVGWISVTAIDAPTWVIKEAGFFNQERLDADLIYIPSSPTMGQAMLAGEVAISGVNSQTIADVGLQGGDLVAMGAVTNVVAFYVMAHPEIKSVNDLRGKPIGVTRFGASTDFGIRMLLN